MKSSASFVPVFTLSLITMGTKAIVAVYGSAMYSNVVDIYDINPPSP